MLTLFLMIIPLKNYPAILHTLNELQSMGTAAFLRSISLSAISAINSELVGLPRQILIVYPKYDSRISEFPLSHAVSIA